MKERKKESHFPLQSGLQLGNPAVHRPADFKGMMDFWWSRSIISTHTYNTFLDTVRENNCYMYGDESSQCNNCSERSRNSFCIRMRKKKLMKLGGTWWIVDEGNVVQLAVRSWLQHEVSFFLILIIIPILFIILTITRSIVITTIAIDVPSPGSFLFHSLFGMFFSGPQVYGLLIKRGFLQCSANDYKTAQPGEVCYNLTNKAFGEMVRSRAGGQ